MPMICNVSAPAMPSADYRRNRLSHPIDMQGCSLNGPSVKATEDHHDDDDEGDDDSQAAMIEAKPRPDGTGGGPGVGGRV
jgi:hypothetical protein